MKLVLLLIVIVGAAIAQQLSLGDWIHLEVETIMAINPNLTIAECTTMCDDLFRLQNIADETVTDNLCHHACECEIDNNCDDHTHPPHPTNEPVQTSRP
ncbi:uncharacterized protein LOC131950182 [Physella acuta]|uniref:uncharacterized protein LOC131950182 n=1 Tax=Physella acuta TaxID=109671 RepID=UPI0027DCA4E6|nr:uncharacterized protein LOC131950182 [Physella acuta]